jgi:hypothetical protein
MKRSPTALKQLFTFTILVVTLFFVTSHLPVQAFTLQSDPQYVVMNFAPMINLNWGADETEWQNVIKPKILTEIHQLKAALPAGTKNRKLAWSTLQEYMNHPLDESSANSYYAIKMRRILEISEEENLPVFLPLNGFQWWDELPELYNWWDVDGSKTPDVFFNRQKNPQAFKERFIKGYNPENKWNVEWQDYETPMVLNWRNWGGGGFRLAPPPNLANQHRTQLSYRKVQAERLRVMLTELVKKLDQWEQEGKTELFAGITIGTEVSLNASVLPRDEFEPYGYRSIQDLKCPTNEATCGATLKLNQKEVIASRQEVVSAYLTDLTRLAVNMGIPKQRIYTHVWSEATEGEARHSNYAPAAFNLYSRAGISLYGYAEKPFDLPDWKNAVVENGDQAWGAVEYSTDKETDKWHRALNNVLNSSLDSAKVITFYNWDEHKDTPAMPAIKNILEEEPQLSHCQLPEILPTTNNSSEAPSKLTWKYLTSDTAKASSLQKLTLTIEKDIYAQPNQNVVTQVDVSPAATEVLLPSLSEGVYTWYLEGSGCSDGRKQFSEPRTLIIPHAPPHTSLWQALWQ